MFGLISKKRHEAILAKAGAIIDDAGRQLDAEEFSLGRTLPQKVAIALKRLAEAREASFKHRQKVLTLQHQLETANAELADFRAKRERANANLRNANAARRMKQGRG